MKKLLVLIMLCYGVNVNGNSWVQKASYNYFATEYPYSFVIGDKRYIGGGTDIFHASYGGFWEYDPLIDVWTQKATPLTAPSYAAIGFSIGNKGYTGLGKDGTGIYSSAFLEYDPSSNVWTSKANFPGYRAFAVNFSIGNFGFVCTGESFSTPTSSIFVSDMWQYDPTSDIWTQKTSLPGVSRRDASGFVIDNNAFIIGGLGGSPHASLSEIWQYNSSTDIWTQKINFPGIPRNGASAFSICDKGYFGLGLGSGNDFWEYIPVNDTWILKTNFPGTNGLGTVHFSIGEKGYVGLGYDTTFYEYNPDSANCATGIQDLTSTTFNFTLSPNPTKDKFTISDLPINKNIELKITDATGKTVLVRQQFITASNLIVPIANLPKGIYFVQVNEGENKMARKLVVE